MNNLQERIEELKERISNNSKYPLRIRDLDHGEMKGIKFAQEEILKMLDDECINPELCEFCPELKRKIKGGK